MAVNLATRYSSKIAEVFTGGSFVKGKTSEDFDLTGVKTLKVYTPITVEETDYVRTGQSRYGIPTEMQDTVQELKMTQDKSFTLTIDKGNNLDQELSKKAGDMLRLQISEKSTPAADKYALLRFVNMSGTVKGLSTPSKTNVVEVIADGAQALDDALVPYDNRYIYVSSDIFKLICLSPEFTGTDSIAKEYLTKGVCGEICGLHIVKVPKSYMPAHTHFIIAHKSSVLFPYKISDAKIHQDPVGVSGALIEGRHYYDAFVLGAKCMGVYSAVNSTYVSTVPTITVASGTATVTGSGTIYTTDDGTDPRYSDTATKYVAGTKLSGDKILAYAVEAGKYPSALAEKII